MNVGKCCWQCARRRQHTEDSKLNVICQVASSTSSMCVRVCVCEHVRTSLCFSFYFISNCCLSWPCLASSFRLSGSCAPSPFLSLSHFSSLSLSPAHTYVTGLMCFKFNLLFFCSLAHTAGTLYLYLPILIKFSTQIASFTPLHS